jgi:hypothetical protein
MKTLDLEVLLAIRSHCPYVPGRLKDQKRARLQMLRFEVGYVQALLQEAIPSSPIIACFA